jgi:hypothetical protein
VPVKLIHFLDSIHQIKNPKFVVVFFRGSHMSIFNAGDYGTPQQKFIYYLEQDPIKH